MAPVPDALEIDVVAAVDRLIDRLDAIADRAVANAHGSAEAVDAVVSHLIDLWPDDTAPGASARTSDYPTAVSLLNGRGSSDVTTTAPFDAAGRVPEILRDLRAVRDEVWAQTGGSFDLLNAMLVRVLDMTLDNDPEDPSRWNAPAHAAISLLAGLVVRAIRK
jgi:hypothetical protein